MNLRIQIISMIDLKFECSNLCKFKYFCKKGKLRITLNLQVEINNWGNKMAGEKRATWNSNWNLEIFNFANRNNFDNWNEFAKCIRFLIKLNFVFKLAIHKKWLGIRILESWNFLFCKYKSF